MYIARYYLKRTRLSIETCENIEFGHARALLMPTRPTLIRIVKAAQSDTIENRLYNFREAPSPLMLQCNAAGIQKNSSGLTLCRAYRYEEARHIAKTDDKISTKPDLSCCIDRYTMLQDAREREAAAHRNYRLTNISLNTNKRIKNTGIFPQNASGVVS